MKDKKINIILLIIIVVLLGVIVFLLIRNKDDNTTKNNEVNYAEKFAEEYTQVEKDNVFVYSDIEEIIDILENGSGVVYLGFPTCITCRENIDLLNEAAKEYNIDKIYYYNIKPIRTTFSLNENNELVTNKGTDFYYELLQILDDYLDFYKLVSSDDKEIISEEKWLTPCMIFVKNGKLVSFISDFSEEDDLKLKEAFEKNLENICDGKC